MEHQFELINPPECGGHPGFSHGVKTPAGNLLFIAGQVGWDQNGKIVSADLAAQFDRALSNVVAVIRAAGGRPENLARLTIYAIDQDEYMANLKSIGESYRRHMGKHYPAMTLVGVKGLAEDGAKLELEATAVL